MALNLSLVNYHAQRALLLVRRAVLRFVLLADFLFLRVAINKPLVNKLSAYKLNLQQEELFINKNTEHY